jgi:hypothetical protein
MMGHYLKIVASSRFWSFLVDGVTMDQQYLKMNSRIEMFLGPGAAMGQN